MPGLTEDAPLIRSIIQSAGIGVWRCDLRTKEVEGDALACRIIGFSESEGALSFRSFLRRVHPIDRGRVLEYTRKLLAGEICPQFDFRVLTETKVPRYVLTRAALEKDGDSGCILGIVQDQTDCLRRYREHQAVIDLSHTLRQVVSVSELVTASLEVIARALDAPHGLFARRERERLEVRVTHACGRWAALVDKTADYREGIIGAVLAENCVFVSRRVWEDPRALQPAFLQGLHGFLAVPLVVSGKLEAVIALGRPEAFDDDEIAVAEALCDVVATALGRMIHEHAVTQRLYEMDILHSIDHAISECLDLEVVLSESLSQVVAHLGVDAAAVLILSRATNKLTCRAATGIAARQIWQAEVPLGESVVGRVAALQAPILLRSPEDIARCPMREDFREFLEQEGFQAYAAFPLIVKHEVAGVLELFNRLPLEFSMPWTKFAELVAGQIAVAVANAELYTDLMALHHELILAYDATIEGWARALEMRDVTTEQHCVRVADFAVGFAARMGYAGDALVNLRRGALLHDIGKIAIPDSVLKKPGPLSDEEWALMREHPRTALELLRPIKFLEASLDIPAYHHERWDGTGYPFGLAGEKIPHAARIFSLVDVYDALTSDRPYRKAWTKAAALDYIMAQAGRMFDPELVPPFIELLRNGDPPFSSWSKASA